MTQELTKRILEAIYDESLSEEQYNNLLSELVASNDFDAEGAEKVEIINRNGIIRISNGDLIEKLVTA
jgi:hypothetical protein